MSKYNREFETEDIEEVLKIIEEQIRKFKPAVNDLIELQDNDVFKVFITGFLSPRTKDEITIEVSKRFFEEIKTMSQISNYTQKEIEELIYPIGFYKTKAKNLIKISQIIKNQYNSKIPNNLEELKKLPGIGDKIANLILSQGFQIPSICVDTHVHRISNRLKIVNTINIAQTQKELEKRIPKKLWLKFNPILVGFGQTICKPQNPNCKICKIKEKCCFYLENKK